MIGATPTASRTSLWSATKRIPNSAEAEAEAAARGAAIGRSEALGAGVGRTDAVADGAAGTSAAIAGTGFAGTAAANAGAGSAGTEAVRVGAHEAIAKVAQQIAAPFSKVRTGSDLLSSRIALPRQG